MTKQHGSWLLWAPKPLPLHTSPYKAWRAGPGLSRDAYLDEQQLHIWARRAVIESQTLVPALPCALIPAFFSCPWHHVCPLLSTTPLIAGMEELFLSLPAGPCWPLLCPQMTWTAGFQDVRASGVRPWRFSSVLHLLRRTAAICRNHAFSWRWSQLNSCDLQDSSSWRWIFPILHPYTVYFGIGVTIPCVREQAQSDHPGLASQASTLEEGGCRSCDLQTPLPGD